MFRSGFACPLTSPLSTKVATEGKVVVLVVLVISPRERSRRYVATLTGSAGGPRRSGRQKPSTAAPSLRTGGTATTRIDTRIS